MPFYAYPKPIKPDSLSNAQKKHVRQANKAVYVAMYILIITYGVLAMIEPLFKEDECTRDDGKQRGNVDYSLTLCQFDREIWLMGMSRFDAMLARRVLIASVLGSIIGWERRAVDRPAGMRTMSLVCMGACLFTITSIFGFIDSPMTWDSSRVSAAIPSGVGFLGAGLIWKTTTGEGQASVHQIHGLTTAASIWLSASIGVAVGGGYYFISIYGVILIVKVLKYGPRMFYQQDDIARYESESSDSEYDDLDHQESEINEDVEYGNIKQNLSEVTGLLGQIPLPVPAAHRKILQRQYSGYQYSSSSFPRKSHSFPRHMNSVGSSNSSSSSSEIEPSPSTEKKKQIKAEVASGFRKNPGVGGVFYS